MSYTQFAYADLKLSEPQIGQGDSLRVSLTVSNTGAVAGPEVVQLYVHDVESSVYRPEQELRAFVKVALEPGETCNVVIGLDDSAFSVYDQTSHAWIVEAGEYEIRVGASSRDIRLRQRLQITSAQKISASQRAVAGPQIAAGGLLVPDGTFAAMLGTPIPEPEPVRPYHVNSSVSEIAETWLGSIVRSRVVASYRKNLGANARDETLSRMFEAMANDMPLRAMGLLGGRALSGKSLNVLVALLNKQFLTALRLQLGREHSH
jgi:beta-glucosidase